MAVAILEKGPAVGAAILEVKPAPFAGTGAELLPSVPELLRSAISLGIPPSIYPVRSVFVFTCVQ